MRHIVRVTGDITVDFSITGKDVAKFKAEAKRLKTYEKVDLPLTSKDWVRETAINMVNDSLFELSADRQDEMGMGTVTSLGAVIIPKGEKL